MRCPHRALGAAALSLALALAACDRDVTDPVVDRGDMEALLARAGLTPAGSELTLPALLRDAIRTVQRDRGTEAARLQLERLQEARSAGRALGAGPAVDSLEVQLRMVLEVLGPGTIDRTVEATSQRLRLLGRAVDSTRSERAPLEALQTLARHELEAVDAARAAGDTIAALQHAAAAAEHAGRLRRMLLDRRRVESLPDLFARAKARLDTVAADRSPALLARHRALSETAREAVAHAGRGEAYRALAALRAEEIRFTLAVLGEEVAGQVVADVGAALVDVRPQLAGNLKLQRMHRAAHDLQVRAAAELARGNAHAGLDLGSHAASLVNALRLVATLR